ncbi:MAG TPA: helix-turn-helix domain-containing protein [Mesorhizobium sp.]|jgi:AcrR family transcriptional regulator
MEVSRQSTVAGGDRERGPRARTGTLMLRTATELMQRGLTPSVSEVAEAAGVSRATAYRYFPSQAAMVQAVVNAGLGPILKWSSKSADAERRVVNLVETSIPRIDAFEATFKAALRLSLEQWAKRQAGTLGEEPEFKRGHRVELLKSALEPLRSTLTKRKFDRLAQALSLVFGVEVLIVLKDIWGLDVKEALSVGRWASGALVRAALQQEGDA